VIFHVQAALRRSCLIRPILRWSQYICLLIGIGALSWCAYGTADAKWTQASLERVLAGVRGRTRPFHPRALAAGPASQETSLVGRIDISRVGISAIVLEGDDTRTLARGVGHIPGTALPGWSGNVGLAGHRDTFFRALHDIRLGDDILVTTLQDSYRYRVVSSEIVSPDETRILDASALPSLTLVTCYPFHFIGSAPKRFIVRAHLVWDEHLASRKKGKSYG
jgi:sortase A